MAENTLWPGGPTQYPWPNAPGTAPNAAPSSTAQGTNPDDIQTKPATASSSSATPPAAKYLTPQEQAAIIKSLGTGYDGWYVIGGAAVPETRPGTDALGKPVNIPTNSYTISISNGKDRTEPITIYPGNKDEAGNDTWIPQKTPQATPKPDTTQQQVIGGTVYTQDPNNPNGPWIPRIIDQTTQDKAKADLAKAGADLNMSQAQLDALKAKTPAEIQQALAAAGASDAQAKKTANDIAIANAKLQGELQQTAASTANTQQQTVESQARVGQIGSAVDIAQKKAPGEIELTGAQTDAQRAAADASRANTARTNQQIAQGNAPNIQANVGTGPYIYKTDPNTGVTSTEINWNYQPKTLAEVAQRQSQLDQMARAKQADLASKQQSGALTADQARQQWTQWYAQTIEPQKSTLDAAYQQAILDQQKSIQEQQRSNLATAQTGAGAILTAEMANRPNSPAYAQALGSVLANTRGAPKGVDFTAALSAPGPDVAGIYEKATAQMLQHISPTAAQMATGQPVPTQLGALTAPGAPSAGLASSNYMPGGAPPPPPAAPPPAAGGGAAAPAQGAPPPPAAPQPDWVSIMARLNQDKADQSRQSRFPGVQPLTPGLYNPYYQQGSAVGQPAIGSVAGSGTYDPNNPWGTYQFPA